MQMWYILMQLFTGAVAGGAESLLPGESARQTEEEHCWKFWPEDKQSEVWQTAGRVSAWVMRAADVAMWQFGHAITGQLSKPWWTWCEVCTQS